NFFYVHKLCIIYYDVDLKIRVGEDPPLEFILAVKEYTLTLDSAEQKEFNRKLNQVLQTKPPALDNGGAKAGKGLLTGFALLRRSSASSTSSSPRSAESSPRNEDDGTPGTPQKLKRK